MCSQAFNIELSRAFKAGSYIQKQLQLASISRERILVAGHYSDCHAKRNDGSGWDEKT